MNTLKFTPKGVTSKTGNNPVRSETISQTAVAQLETVIRCPEVCKTLGIGKTHLYALIKNKEFPKPIGLGGRSVGWLMSDVQKFITARVAESRGNA